MYAKYAFDVRHEKENAAPVDIFAISRHRIVDTVKKRNNAIAMCLFTEEVGRIQRIPRVVTE